MNIIERINTLSEDRRIDILSARVIADEFNIKLKNENELLELKQDIDRYLATFSEKDALRLYEKTKDYEDEYASYRVAGGNSDFEKFLKLAIKHVGKTGKELYNIESGKNTEPRHDAGNIIPFE